MITTIKTEATSASENLHYILTHECDCEQRVCCRRLLVGIALTLLFALPIIVLMYVEGQLSADALFSIISFSAIMAVLSLVVTCIVCRRYVFRRTGRPLTKMLLYFGKYDLDAVRHFVETGGRYSDADVEALELPNALPNGPVLLCVLFSDDAQMAFCRVMRYEGFSYVPVGQDHLYTAEDAERVRASVRRAWRP